MTTIKDSSDYTPEDRATMRRDFERRVYQESDKEDSDHPHSAKCGFDRNASISEDRYVCMCGWRSPESSGGEQRNPLVQAVTLKSPYAAGPELSDIEHPMQHAQPDAQPRTQTEIITANIRHDMLCGRLTSHEAAQKYYERACQLERALAAKEAERAEERRLTDHTYELVLQRAEKAEVELTATHCPIHLDATPDICSAQSCYRCTVARCKRLAGELADLKHDIAHYVKTNAELATDLHEMMLGEGEEGAARIATEQRLAAVEAAVSSFLTKYDELNPHVTDYIKFCAIHNLPWIYGDWKSEIDALRALAAAKEGKA